MTEETLVPEFERLRETAPDAYSAVVDALTLAEEQELQPRLLRAIHRGLDGELAREDVGPDPEDPLERAATEFTEQFAFFVAGMTPEQLQPLEEQLSTEELHTFAKTLYALDMGYRLRVVHRGLFGSGDGPLEPLPPHTPREGRTMDGALKEIWRVATVMADTKVDDPETIEFLRLRCAWYHDCST